jgi:hypothetical protein
MWAKRWAVDSREPWVQSGGGAAWMTGRLQALDVLALVASHWPGGVDLRPFSWVARFQIRGGLALPRVGRPSKLLVQYSIIFLFNSNAPNLKITKHNFLKFKNFQTFPRGR